MSNNNLIIECDRAFVANVPAAPGNNATCVLFATHPRKPGGSGSAVVSTFESGTGTEPIDVNPDAIEEVEVTFHAHDKASAANGLRAYVTVDGGTTWNETDMKGYVAGAANQPSIGAAAPIQIPALSAGQEWVETFDAGRYRGFAIEYTAGATGPTPVTGWSVSVTVNHASQRD
jgi:hypothetical protein